jgi:hypothetical protein
MSPLDQKAAHQDAYGNIKVPNFDTLAPSLSADTDWRGVPENGSQVIWSSLTGLPVLGLPTAGNSSFTLNTGYMTTDCQTRGEESDYLYRDMQDFNYTVGGGWSGANFAISGLIVTYYGAPAANFVFRAIGSSPETEKRTLTVANCTAYMHYVEQEVQCGGRSCRSVRVRPAQIPAGHVSPIWDNAVVKANMTEYTPLNGLAQKDSMVLQFFKNFINATNPSQACSTSACPMSGVEGFLVQPENPFNVRDIPLIWQQGDEIVSQRMTQLINTYWLNSIAPYSLTGNFALPLTAENLAFQYNTDSVSGFINTAEVVIRYRIEWMVILLIASAVMFACGCYSTVVGMKRKGPEILDSFTALLRDNPYVKDVGYTSMDDAAEQAKRLRRTIVRLGDVRPDHEIGHVAIAASGAEGFLVGNLSPKKLYD